MNTSSLSQAAAAALRADTAAPLRPALLGFDGFVDTICHVVDKRHDYASYERIRTLHEFGSRIAAAAGQSTNLEVVPVMVKLGGNGPIMANALTALGTSVTYCGMTGYPHTHPIFADLAERAALLPLGEPALTDAYEFDDGKLIVGKLATVAEANHERLMERVGPEDWSLAWESAGFVAMVNWTMLPHMTTMWRQLQADFGAGTGRKLMFFDLADPEKRSAADLAEALEVLAAFQNHHDVMLGLNEKEALQVGDVLNLSTPLERVLTVEDAPPLAAAIRARLGIHAVVVHPTRFAAGATATAQAAVVGPWTATPKISTGAGDHFNAGFCFGRILGAGLAESLQIGVGTSGYYVREAASPTREQLADFLENL